MNVELWVMMFTAFFSAYAAYKTRAVREDQKLAMKVYRRPSKEEKNKIMMLI